MSSAVEAADNAFSLLEESINYPAAPGQGMTRRIGSGGRASLPSVGDTLVIVIVEPLRAMVLRSSSFRDAFPAANCPLWTACQSACQSTVVIPRQRCHVRHARSQRFQAWTGKLSASLIYGSRATGLAS